MHDSADPSPSPSPGSHPGPKALRLAELRAAGFPVPPFVTVAPDALDRFLSQDPESADLFAHYRQGFVNKLDVLGRAQRVAERILLSGPPEFLVEQLRRGLDEAGAPGPWIARSSGSLEDADGVDLAGAYESVPGLDSVEQAAAGVLRCWASLFSPRALLRFAESSEFVDGAVRDLSAARMGVIVQTQVRGSWSGVAFTADPATGNAGLVLVEAARELGGIADGGATAVRALATRQGRDVRLEQCDPELPEPLAEAVVRLADRVHHWAGAAQDVEWAADAEDRVWVVQTRPVRAEEPPPPNGAATTGAAPGDAADGFAVARVGHEPEGFPLGHCVGIARSYRAKKLGLRGTAEELGIPVPAWYWLRYDAAGLAAAAVQGRLPRFDSGFVQLDVSTNIRALVRPVSQLTDVLGLLADAQPGRQLTVHLRDAVPTQIGAVSAVTRGGGVRIEYVVGALQGLRNGVSEASWVETNRYGQVVQRQRVHQSQMEQLVPEENRITRRPLGRVADALPEPAVRDIDRWTRLLAERQPGIRPEWWLHADRVWLADASLEEGTLGGTPLVLSDGAAEGTVVRVTAQDLPEDLSNGYAISTDAVNADAYDLPALREFRRRRPWLPDRDWIVVSDRPRVELSLLLPWANGFVFEQGSMLSHLAITLRAKGRPAVVADDTAVLADGARAAIRDGAVVVAAPEPH